VPSVSSSYRWLSAPCFILLPDLELFFRFSDHETLSTALEASSLITELVSPSSVSCVYNRLRRSSVEPLKPNPIHRPNHMPLSAKSSKRRNAKVLERGSSRAQHKANREEQRTKKVRRDGLLSVNSIEETCHAC